MSSTKLRVLLQPHNRQSAERLRQLRKQAEMSQPEVAEYLGISPQQYHLYERGKAFVPYAMVRQMEVL